MSELITHDKRIKLINLEENCGAAVARNTGVKHPSGAIHEK